MRKNMSLSGLLLAFLAVFMLGSAEVRAAKPVGESLQNAGVVASGNMAAGIPPHDLFGNARNIAAFPYIDTVQDMQLATTSPGDPGQCSGDNVHNLWYRFTATKSGFVQVDTRGSGDGSTRYFDTVLSVFSGNYGSFTRLACNDDSAIPRRNSLLNLPVQAGVTYTILVSKYNAAIEPGPLVLNANFSLVRVDPIAIYVNEGEPGQNYGVTLASPPIADVTVTLTTDDELATVSPSALTFTPANWNQTQAVAVTAIDNSTWNPFAVISHSVASVDQNFQTDSGPVVAVRITENEPIPGLVVAPDRVSVAEGGPSAQYRVTLNTRPEADVRVDMQFSAQLSIDPASLVFTRADWNQPRTVTVAAVDDAEVEAQRSEGVGFIMSSEDENYVGLAPGDLMRVNVVDNDSAGVSISPIRTSVVRGGTTTYRVVLTYPPTADVTIAMSPSPEVTVDTNALVFTPADWNQPRTITVTAVDGMSSDGEIQHSATSADAAYEGIAINRVAVRITEADDSPDLAVTLTDDTGLVLPGALHDYVVTVSALGVVGSNNARYTSVLPPVLQGAVWTCEPAAKCPATEGSGDADLSVNLSGGDVLTFTITGTVAENAAGSMSHAVEISPPLSQVDSNPDNNRAVDTNLVDRYADGFDDGFEDVNQGLVKRIRSTFTDRRIVLERERMALLASLDEAVPLPVLEWELPEGRGEVAVHLRSLEGRHWMRLAMRAPGATWRPGDWQVVEADQSMQVVLEAAPEARSGEVVRLLDSAGRPIATLALKSLLH